ncbi:MAG: sigma-70 family RNA polymerase sigma factor [Paracoccaceae bacterium]
MTPPLPLHTQQTVWMLAVRDHQNRAAFSELFDAFAPRLKGFLMLGGTKSEAAEEIVQEVMLTVWRKAAQFDPSRAPVSAWIYQIARNRQIDLMRKERRPMPEPLESPARPEPPGDELLAIEQEAEALRKALARLSAEQREMIEKAYMGELSHQEISSQTGLPLGTIKSRIRLGLERLRHELKDMR